MQIKPKKTQQYQWLEAALEVEPKDSRLLTWWGLFKSQTRLLVQANNRSFFYQHERQAYLAAISAERVRQRRIYGP